MPVGPFSGNGFAEMMEALRGVGALGNQQPRYPPCSIASTTLGDKRARF